MLPVPVIAKVLGPVHNLGIRNEVEIDVPKAVLRRFERGIKSVSDSGKGFSVITHDDTLVHITPTFTSSYDVQIRCREHLLQPKCPLEHVRSHTHINGTILCVCDDCVLAFSRVKTKEQLYAELLQQQKQERRLKSKRYRALNKIMGREAKYDGRPPEEVSDSDLDGSDHEGETPKDYIEEVLFNLKATSGAANDAILGREFIMPSNASYSPDALTETQGVFDDTKRTYILQTQTMNMNGTARSMSATNTRRLGSSTQGLRRSTSNSSTFISPQSQLDYIVARAEASKAKKNDGLLSIVHGDCVQLLEQPPRYYMSEIPRKRVYQQLTLSKLLSQGKTELTGIITYKGLLEQETGKRRILVFVQSLSMHTKVSCLEYDSFTNQVTELREIFVEDHFVCGDIFNDIIVICSPTRLYFLKILIGVSNSKTDINIEIMTTAVLEFVTGERPISAKISRDDSLWLSANNKAFNTVRCCYVIIVTNRLRLSLFRLPELVGLSVVLQTSTLPCKTLALLDLVETNTMPNIYIQRCSIAVSANSNMFLILPQGYNPLLLSLPLPKNGYNIPLGSIGSFHFPLRTPWHTPPTLYEAMALGSVAQNSHNEHLRDACLTYITNWDRRFSGSIIPHNNSLKYYEDIKKAFQSIDRDLTDPSDFISLAKLASFLDVVGYAPERKQIERYLGIDEEEESEEQVLLDFE